MSVPDGSTGYLRDIGFGGHPLTRNALAEDKGDYDVDYTLNAGLLLRQDQRSDLVLRVRGPVHQPVPPGLLRRALPLGRHGRHLPGWLPPRRQQRAHQRPLAPRFARDGAPGRRLAPQPDIGNGDPRDPNSALYPKNPIGWTSWWPTEGPAMCFPSNGSNICYGYTGNTGDFKPINPTATVGLDPEIGWEVQ